MKRFILRPFCGLGLLAMGALVSGCHTVNTVNTLEPATPAARRELVTDKRVVTDATLHERVRIIGLNQYTAPGGFLKLQVEVLNLTSSVQTFSYRWEWFDDHGIIIDAPTSTAVTRQIEGKESLFLTGTAPLATAKDFRLKLIGNLR